MADSMSDASASASDAASSASAGAASALGNITSTENQDAAMGALNALSSSFSDSFAQPLKAMLPRGFTPGFAGAPRAFFWFLFNDPEGLADECSQGTPADDSACSYLAFVSMITAVGVIIPILSLLYCFGFCCARGCTERCGCCGKVCKQPNCGGSRPSGEYSKAERSCCIIIFLIFFLLIAFTGIFGFLSTNQIGVDMQDVIKGMKATTTFPDVFSDQVNASFATVEKESNLMVTNANARLSGRDMVRIGVKDLNSSLWLLEDKFEAVQQLIEGKTDAGAQNPCAWKIDDSDVVYDAILLKWRNATGGEVYASASCCATTSVAGCVTGSHVVGVGGGSTSINCKNVTVLANNDIETSPAACSCCCGCYQRLQNLADTVMRMPTESSLEDLNKPISVGDFGKQVSGAQNDVAGAIDSFRETFTSLSDALTPVEGFIGDQTTMTGGGLVMWGLSWVGVVLGLLGLITARGCCWWTSFFIGILCMLIFWILFGVTSIIVLPFGDLCDGMPSSGEDATAWLLTFASTSGAIATVDPTLRALYKDCLVQSPGFSGNLWSVVGMNESTVKSRFASFNVSKMIPRSTVVVNLDTDANTKSFTASKNEMKNMTANQPALVALKAALTGVVAANISSA
ncbi:hypothetical protein T484DRAFT_2183516 [Baffinella frigidus]|nr:hypothetical protein T484DRAFT_2183516 [Cryptophyta sp. CCMP2293]